MRTEVGKRLTRKRSCARRDVHWGSASKVQPAHFIRPTGGVPSPARDKVVYDGGPDEHEDDAGQHTTALSDGAGRERHGDSREHALVDGEEEVGKPGGPHGRAAQHAAEPEIGQVPDVRPRRVRERQRVPPEKPLEARHGRRHDREPDKRQRRLPPGQAGVEKS